MPNNQTVTPSPTTTQGQDRILSGAITLSLVSTSGAVTASTLTEIDKGSIKRMPVMETTQPVGATVPHNQLKSVTYEVTLEGGMVDSAFKSLANAADAALISGTAAPSITLACNVAANAAGTSSFAVTLSGGTLGNWQMDFAAANTPLTDSVTMTFSQMT